jgi:hypothetical protein
VTFQSVTADSNKIFLPNRQKPVLVAKCDAATPCRSLRRSRSLRRLSSSSRPIIGLVSALRKTMSINSEITFPSRCPRAAATARPRAEATLRLSAGDGGLFHLAIAAIVEASKATISTMRFAHWFKSRAIWGLDIHAATVRAPYGRIFVNPRSCFGFRFEETNVALHSVGECNSNAPCRIAL